MSTYTVRGDKSSSFYTSKEPKHPKQTIKNKQTPTVNKWRLGGPIPQSPSAAIAWGEYSFIEGPEQS